MFFIFMNFMVQNEVADRFTAKVGTKEYNSLTVFLNYKYDVKKLFMVNRKCFYPVPNVDSAVVCFKKKNIDYGVLNEDSFENFLSKEVKIVVAGTKAWEMDSIFKCVTMLEKVPDVNYIFNFSSNEEKIAFNKYLKNIKNI